MQVPTTKRQYYDTTKKVSSLAAYSGAIREGAEAWGKLFDGQQKANMESLQIDVENEVKAEFARKSPEYDNNPDNPEFKQYMDDFRKQKYSEAREQVNPFYRGQFDALTRENDKRYNSAFDGWKMKQRQANASNNVKKISQDMINTAYLAGQTGEPSAFEDAKAQYNRQIATIRNISTTTLGARATEQAIDDLNKQYIMSFAQGSIETNPYSMDEKLSDPKFVKEVGADNVERLKKYSTGIKERYKKTGDLEQAKTQTVYDLELPEELKEISKIKEPEERTFAYMQERLKAIDLYKKQDIDEKTFKTIMNKSVTPLIKDIESTESVHWHWYKPNGAFRDGIDVIKTLDIPNNEQKAYLYTNLYDALSKDGIAMGSTDSMDKNRAKEIALGIKKEYLENKNANLVGLEVNRVLLGNDVIEAYKPNKQPSVAKPKWKIWQRNDGTKYKVLPDKNGEYTNNSVFIKIGE